MTRILTFLSFVFFFAGSTLLSAQSNDECSGATLIADPTNFCITPLEDNTNATASPQAFPACWSNVAADLWYTFTAVAPDVAIVVKGATPTNPGGTVNSPQIALYSGDCGNLAELGCSFDNNSINNLPLFVTGLTVGQQYYIRVDAVLSGTFQLCIKNEEVINVVSGDCPTATFVCSKSPIEVSSVFNAGNDPFEINDAACFQGLGGESSSAWYVFTAANAGKLEFTITPNDPVDDLDFVLYRLPNGAGDCSGKISERCMAAGDFAPTSPCMGPTGLNATATDVNQTPGCAQGQDNFLRFLTLVPGRTYALVINNFTAVGNGFTIEWGGNAIFEGTGTANFFTDEPDKKLCLGEELAVTDSSFVDIGNITNWHWNFGAGASPDTISGVGPHTVHYQTVGPKSIVLTILNDQGCAALDTAFLLVELCCILEADVAVQPGCPNKPPTPAEAMVTISNGIEPFQITWSSSPLNTADTILIDSSGTYYVLVEDANGCTDSVSFQVTTPFNITTSFPPDTTTIFVGETVNLTVSTIPNMGATITWQSSTSPTLMGPVQNLSPEESVSYLVTVNNLGCKFSDSVTIVIQQPRFERPNAFTPNGDGANDTFGPVLLGHTFEQLEVWSRWGDKMFDSLVEGRDTWDGTINGEPAPSDVYVYRVRVLLRDGQEVVEKGDVTLLR